MSCVYNASPFKATDSSWSRAPSVLSHPWSPPPSLLLLLLSPPFTHQSVRPPPLLFTHAHRFAHRLLRHNDQRFPGGGDPSSGQWRRRRSRRRERSSTTEPSGRQCHHPDILHGSTAGEPEPSQQQQRCRPEPHVLRGPEHLLPGTEHPDADLQDHRHRGLQRGEDLPNLPLHRGELPRQDRGHHRRGFQGEGGGDRGGDHQGKDDGGAGCGVVVFTHSLLLLLLSFCWSAAAQSLPVDHTGPILSFYFLLIGDICWDSDVGDSRYMLTTKALRVLVAQRKKTWQWSSSIQSNRCFGRHNFGEKNIFLRSYKVGQ